MKLFPQYGVIYNLHNVLKTEGKVIAYYQDSYFRLPASVLLLDLRFLSLSSNPRMNPPAKLMLNLQPRKSLSCVLPPEKFVPTAMQKSYRTVRTCMMQKWKERK